MRIGNITTKNNIFLAPMAGVTDLPFRLLCLEQGCGLVYTEMVSAKGLVYNNENTRLLLQTAAEERNYVGVQLFGSDPVIMAEAAKMVEEFPFSFIDINMGCPVPKVVKNGEGSALMRNPLLMCRIISAVSKAVKIPVTVKLRKAFDQGGAFAGQGGVDAVQAARIAEDSGAAAVAVHGRTREQYYSGHADWDCIARVKAAVSIPVIGNGDVTGSVTARELLSFTGCDGIMIGRAAQGNPWIFGEIDHYLGTGELPSTPSIEDRKRTALRHCRMLADFKGERLAVLEMRRHLCWYIKGLPGAGALRVRLNKAENYGELEELLNGGFV